MTEEDDLKQKLKDLGFDPENPTWKKSKSVDLGKLPLIVSQREAMEKIALLLEAQVASDQAQIVVLEENRARLKRGGGL